MGSVELNNNNDILFAYLDFACTLLDNDNLVEAFVYIQECKKISESIQIPEERALHLLYTQALYYAKLGDTAQACEFANKVLELCGDRDSIYGYKNCSAALIEIEKVVGLSYNDDENEVREGLFRVYAKVRELIFSEDENVVFHNIFYNFILSVRGKRLLEHLQYELATEALLAEDFEFVSAYLEPIVLYIQSLGKSGEDRLEVLSSAYCKAVEQGHDRLVVYICEDLGEFYYPNSFKYLDYLTKAGEAVERLLKRVPERHHEFFLERHGLKCTAQKMEELADFLESEEYAEMKRKAILAESQESYPEESSPEECCPEE